VQKTRDYNRGKDENWKDPEREWTINKILLPLLSLLTATFILFLQPMMIIQSGVDYFEPFYFFFFHMLLTLPFSK